nr:hypothetical protein GCM10025732_31340 [Glycomyces mayteni]
MLHDSQIPSRRRGHPYDYSSEPAPFKRRSLFKAAGLGAAGAAGLPIIAACSDIESGGGSTQATEGFDFLPEHVDWPLPVQPDLVGEPPNHPSGFTSYPEPVQAVTDVPAGSGAYELTVPCWGPAPPRTTRTSPRSTRPGAGPNSNCAKATA